MNHEKSIEELLKNLRATISEKNQKYESNEQENILELTNPIKTNKPPRANNYLNTNESNDFNEFLKLLIKQSLLKIVNENDMLIKDAVFDNLQEQEMRNLICNIVFEYLENNQKYFDDLFKHVVEIKIAKLMNAI